MIHLYFIHASKIDKLPGYATFNYNEIPTNIDYTACLSDCFLFSCNQNIVDDSVFSK